MEAHQAPLSIGFPRQKYWSGLSFPSPGTPSLPWARDGTCVSCIGRQIIFHWTNWEAHIKIYLIDNNTWCICLNCDFVTLVLVAQLYPTLCDPMYSSPPGSSAHEILQAKILECFAILFSKGSSRHKDQTWVSCIIGRWILYQLSHQRSFISLKGIFY